MSRSLVIINSKAAREKIARWAFNSPPGTRVEFKAPRRTIDQNALLWARLTEISKKVNWYGQKLTSEDWKDLFTASLRKAHVVPGIDGDSFVPLGMRTSDMTKEEMGNLLDLIDAFAAERGVIFEKESDGEKGILKVSESCGP